MQSNLKKYKYNSFVPYRICPLGAHVDHQLGKAIGMTLDKGIQMEYNQTSDGSFKVIATDFNGHVEFTYQTIPNNITNSWENYLIGSIKVLQEKYILKYGIDAYIHKSIPIGGLASSSAIIITYIKAISKVNDIKISDKELVSLVVTVEHKYLNTKVGILDPSCEIYCKNNTILYLDIKENINKLIQTNEKLNFKICLIYSGLSRRLSNTIYNDRVNECKSVAHTLNKILKNENINIKDAYLGNFSYNEFLENKRFFSENQIKRAKHFYTEIERVEKGIKYLQIGDIENFGKLVFQSGTSSIENYETGSEYLLAIHKISQKTKGIYGGRFSGAGFNGYYMALIDPVYEEKIKETITREYLSIYPHLKNEFIIYTSDIRK